MQLILSDYEKEVLDITKKRDDCKAILYNHNSIGVEYNITVKIKDPELAEMILFRLLHDDTDIDLGFDVTSISVQPKMSNEEKEKLKASVMSALERL